MTDLYLDLLKKCLTDSIYGDSEHSVNPLTGKENDWNTRGQTMIGMKRLENLQECIEDVIYDEIPGDLIETGVWRGGACIFMRGVLKAHEEEDLHDRTVWVADSFEGLPPPNVEKYPADARSELYKIKELAVSLEEVKANFARYGLLDEQVQFIKGWFRDTLPGCGTQLAILRLDGDLYESTWLALANLYPNLSPGGYVIVDDYGAIWGAKKATDDYRVCNRTCDGVGQELRAIDPGDYRQGVYWRKER